MAGTSEAKPGRPQFSAYVLLSEPIRFNTVEIRNALREDYPGLELAGEGAHFVPDSDCDTDQFVTAPVLPGGSGADDAIATLIRLPGFGQWSMGELSHRQHRMVPDMAKVLKRNASYICVSVGATGDQLPDTFRAARLCSCLAAVFARLPVALAVYWESADHFLPPERVVAMADKAMHDDWPLESWVSFAFSQTRAGAGSLAQVGTRGLLPFKGYEISVAPAPVPLEEAVATASAATTMVLDYGHVYKDGDTIGQEDQSPAESWRIRHVATGTGTEVDFDVMMLVHPQSPLDHVAMAGPMRSRQAPPGIPAQKRGRPGFLRRLLRGRPA